MGNETILVADDEQDIGRLLELALTRGGYRVVRASDGEETLAKIAEERPDLLVLDVMMPRLDGIQVCKRLKGDAGTAGIPIILLTAKAQVTDTAAGISAGADDYIPKPFNYQEVLARVHSLLGKA